MKILKVIRPLPNFKLRNQFIAFLSPLFLILLADSMMAYSFPIVVEESLGSASQMGFIIGLSSVAGIAIDVFFPQFVRADSWKKLFSIGIILSLFFPISMLLGTYSYPFLFFAIATFFWGGYFELITFSMQDFIINEEKKKNFNRDWAFINIFWQIASFIAPIVAIVAFEHSVTTLANQVIFFQIAAFIIFVLITIRNTKDDKKHLQSHVRKSISFLREIQVFELLSSKIWVPMAITFLLNVTIAIMWDFGGLFGEVLANETIPGWLFFSCYTVAVMIGSFILASFPVQKKQTQLSLLCLFIGGICIAGFYFTQSSFIIFSLTFAAYLFFAIVGPLNDSVYSDLASRNKGNEIYLLSLHRLVTSFTYVITPVLVGILIEMFHFKNTFALCGVVIGICALLILISRPKNIRLPQRKLHILEN